MNHWTIGTASRHTAAFEAPVAAPASRLAGLLQQLGAEVVVHRPLSLVRTGAAEPTRPAHTRHAPAAIVDLYERHVFGALKSIAPAEREYIELTYFDGLDADEIASRCGVSAHAVEDRLRRGMDGMLDYLRARV